MVGKIDAARDKWERKMSNAGAKWKRGVTGKVSAFAKGMAEFLGLSDINSLKKDAWTAGVDATSADSFQSMVAGKGPKWEAKLIDSFK